MLDFVCHDQGGCHNDSQAQVQIPSLFALNAPTTVETSTELLSSTQFTANITVLVPAGEPSNPKTDWVVTFLVFLNNTQGSNAQGTSDGIQWGQHTVDNCTGPAIAEVDIEYITCTGQGNINIQMTLKGWVAFFYGSKTRFIYLPTPIIAKANSELTLSLALSANTTSYGSVLGTKCNPT